MAFTLTQAARILKSEWLLIFLAIISISLITLTIYSFGKHKTALPEPNQKIKQVAWQNNIFTGTTTKEELESKLGEPIKVTQTDQKLSYLYPSQSQYRPHEVIFEQDTAVLIKEQVIGNEKGTLNNYTQKYGLPESIIYGQHGTAAPGHYWGSRGFLVFANIYDGTIVEIWYFEPQVLSEFLAKNPDFNTEPPHRF